MTSCVALLARTESPALIERLNRFEATGHKVYLFVDNPKTSGDVRVIWVSDEACLDSGICSLNERLFKTVTSWDRALCYFTKQSNAEHIWFIEDDVFFKDWHVLLELDDTFPDADLLCRSHNSVASDPNWPHWQHIKPAPQYNEHLHFSMVCVCRLSRKLLERILTYANENMKLFFLEAFFNTMVEKHQLRHSHPRDLSDVRAPARVWHPDSIQDTTSRIIHPVKDMEIYKKWQNQFTEDPALSLRNP